MINKTKAIALFTLMLLVVSVGVGTVAAGEWDSNGEDTLEVYEGAVNETGSYTVTVNASGLSDPVNSTQDVALVSNYNIDNISSSSVSPESGLTLNSSGYDNDTGVWYRIYNASSAATYNITVTDGVNIDTQEDNDTVALTDETGTLNVAGVYANDSGVTVDSVSDSDDMVQVDVVEQSYDISTEFSTDFGNTTVDDGDVNIPVEGDETEFSVNSTLEVNDNDTVSNSEAWFVVNRSLATVTAISVDNGNYVGTTPGYGNDHAVHVVEVDNTSEDVDVEATLTSDAEDGDTFNDSVWTEVSYDNGDVVGAGMVTGTSYDVTFGGVDGASGAMTILPVPDFFTNTFGSQFGSAVFYFLIVAGVVSVLGILYLASKSETFSTKGEKAVGYGGIGLGGLTSLFTIPSTPFEWALVIVVPLLVFGVIYLWVQEKNSESSTASVHVD